MKNIIKKSMIIAFVYYAAALSSCYKDTCNFPPAKKGKFKYSGITSENLIYDFKSSTAFSTALTTTDTIAKNKYGIRFMLNYTTACLPERKQKQQGLMNTAYACSPVNYSYISSDSIKNISVKTMFDLDGTHPAGSDVTDYFNAVYQFYSATEPIRYEKAFPVNYFEFGEHYTSKGTKEYDLYFNHSAIDNKVVAFELIIEYTNGKTITAKTKPVFLN